MALCVKYDVVGTEPGVSRLSGPMRANAATWLPVADAAYFRGEGALKFVRLASAFDRRCRQATNSTA